MKGESKFFIKAVYLILILISISLFIHQYISTQRKNYEINQKMNLRIVAENILDGLTTSESCLAYEEDIILGNTKINEIDHKILDIKKIKEFENKYQYFEPDCSRNYNYGYYVIIEKSDLTIIEGENKNIIPKENKDIVLAIDASSSMNTEDKINGAKDAAITFLKCASDTNRVGLVVFRDCDVVEKLSDLVDLENNRDILKRKIREITTLGSTNIRYAISLSTEILKQQSTDPNRYKMIVLLTDGCDTCDDCEPKHVGGQSYCDAWENYCNSCPSTNTVCDFAVNQAGSDIHIFTTGFYTLSACDKEVNLGGAQLKCMSDKTNGKYYLATSTERLEAIFCELGRGIEKVVENKETWIFGSQSHSEQNSLQNKISISIPISIRYNETYIQPGKITIYLFDGELEELTGLVEQVCAANIDLKKTITLSYRTFLKNENNMNKICMNLGQKEICKTLSCDKEIIFESLIPGTYSMNVKANNNQVYVVV